MGACFEIDRARLNGEDIGKAFDRTAENARYYNGHGGYTGTIAEANGYKIVGHEETLDKARDEANATAEAECDNEKSSKYPFAEKWGPALAITYGPDKNKPEGVIFYGWYSS